MTTRDFNESPRRRVDVNPDGLRGGLPLDPINVDALPSVFHSKTPNYWRTGGGGGGVGRQRK